jgi:hypothetical protein
MDTFIQPKITGYHQLSEEEAALMNEGKALAERLGVVLTIEQVQLHPLAMGHYETTVGVRPARSSQ